MKKLRIVLCVLLSVCLLGGCRHPDDTRQAKEKNVILCTTFAAYDWVREILGDSETFSCRMLVDNGVDLHSYQPSAQDIMKISNCRMLIYVGGESDTWVADAVRESGNDSIVAVSLMELVGDHALEEVELEGVESHHHHEDADEHGTEIGDGHDDQTDETDDAHTEQTDDVDSAHDDHTDEADRVLNDQPDEIDDTQDTDSAHDDHSDEADSLQNDQSAEIDDTQDTDSIHDDHYDEHVWLSLTNAEICTELLADQIAALDPEHADSYAEHAETYIGKLRDLDARYRDMRANAARDTILIADRFPFLYLASDYDIHYYAAYSGCSADAEASVDTVLYLAKQLETHDLPTEYVVDNGTEDLANTIAECAGCSPEVLQLFSMQSVTKEEIAEGCTYLSYMEKNLEALKKGLCGETD